MTTLLLLVDLRDDETNTIRSVLSHHYAKTAQSPLAHVGVCMLSDRVFAFDRTIAHSALVRVCAVLAEKGWPYLLAHIQSDASVLAGKPAEEVAALLKSVGVPSAPQP